MPKIPNHVAIILDGNGRWAKSKGMPRNYGHTMGAKNVEGVCRAAYDLGIRHFMRSPQKTGAGPAGKWKPL